MRLVSAWCSGPFLALPRKSSISILVAAPPEGTFAWCNTNTSSLSRQRTICRHSRCGKFRAGGWTSSASPPAQPTGTRISSACLDKVTGRRLEPLISRTDWGAAQTAPLPDRDFDLFLAVRALGLTFSKVRAVAPIP
jgi:hypothetical protein